MPQAPLEKENRLSEKFTRTIFFLSALLFHLVLFLAVAGWIVFRVPPPQPDPGIVNIAPVTPVSHVDVVVKVDPSSVIPNPPILPPVIVSTGGTSKFLPHTPSIEDGLGNHETRGDSAQPHTAPINPSGPDPRVKVWSHTVEDIWQRTPEQIANHDPSCSFPVYIASYADGDWACNTRLDRDGNIVAGSIPNLVAKISEWSHGTIKGHVVPKPLDIASPELLSKMPPFIFFTGHKDFVLTDREVENLRQYLNDGGLIWGDNALAGEGSRFDIAFHREMKRVIPDRDKNFTPYSITDDIFAKGRYPLSEIPAGMNYYAEAPQHLDIDGILAILYTPNDYGDMMFMRINPGDESFFMTRQPIPPGTLYTNTSFVDKQSIFYRNFDLKSSLTVHHMGMNIITYLLVRFDDKLLLDH